MYNLRIKLIIKVIKISSKISVKTILMTKPVILNPNSPKTNKRQNIVDSAGKIPKFCLRIKISLKILQKEVFFAKFRTMTLSIAKIHKSLVKKLTGYANFQNCPERLKNYNVS